MWWNKKKQKVVITRQPVELVSPVAEEARGWLSMGVGKYHQASLNKMLEDLKEDWANGVFTGDSVEETAQKNAEAIGKVQQLAEIILTLEEMTLDEEDED